MTQTEKMAALLKRLEILEADVARLKVGAQSVTVYHQWLVQPQPSPWWQWSEPRDPAEPGNRKA